MNHLGDTLNFDKRTIDYMAEHPAERANMIGHQLPYHLQYLMDGKPDVRPEGKDGKTRRECN